jgi:DNA-binding transcriptional ArsR family regulator
MASKSDTEKKGGANKDARRWRRARALEHPVRAQALRLLVERGKMSPRQIADEIEQRTPEVSYHCKQLVAYDCAELVEERRVEGKGAVEHFYIATERPHLNAADWDEMDSLAAEGFLHEIMTAMIRDYEASLGAGIIGADSEFHLTRTPMFFDREGVREAMKNCERWLLEQSQIEARSAARRDASGEAAIPVSSSLAFFKMSKPEP